MHYLLEECIFQLITNFHPLLCICSYFVNQLRIRIRSTLRNGVVFWYDSIIASGQVNWQNEVNERNVEFLRSSNGMLINYNWNDDSLTGTGAICDSIPTPRHSVFFGIDIFGRGQVAKFQSKRTLARIIQERFSTGLFAPAWTYETLRNYGYNIQEPHGLDEVNDAFLLRNEKFWWLLWENFATHPYHQLPFYTDFCLGSGKRFHQHGQPSSPMKRTPSISRTKNTMTFATHTSQSQGFLNLSQQSLQPSVPLHELVKRYYDDAYHGGSCLQILSADNNFRVFACDMPLSSKCLICSYAFKCNSRDGEFDCVLRFCVNDNSRDCYLFLGDYYNTSNLQKGRCYVSPLTIESEQFLLSSYISPKLPLHGKNGGERAAQSTPWMVRHYLISFDTSIQIKDIGILYRRRADALDTAYLGAIFLNSYPLQAFGLLPGNSNATHIPIQRDNLLN